MNKTTTMIRYDPVKHHRHSIRLKGFDYTQSGAYFITIVTKNRELLFGKIVENTMRLNTFGQIVNTFWQDLPDHFPQVVLDAWVVMPNHVHAILWIVRVDYTTGERQKVFANLSTQTDNRPQSEYPKGAQSGSLGAILGNFQMTTARRINRIRKSTGTSVWQRDFYDDIIRNQRHLEAARQYIRNNPMNWLHDTDNPA